MVDYQKELEEMVCSKNLMNSYKLYFLKTLVINVSKEKTEFSFYELASWMCAYSFEDVCLINGRIRPLDKLYDIAVQLIEKENIYQSAKVAEVFDAAYKTENKSLRKEIKDLCNYVPYRLLAYIWVEELKGKTDTQKNHMIEEFSRSEERNMYAIFTISSKEKKIEVKTEWAKYITEHRNNLLIWLNNKIRLFIGRES
jgi:hypothetical protein